MIITFRKTIASLLLVLTVNAGTAATPKETKPKTPKYGREAFLQYVAPQGPVAKAGNCVIPRSHLKKNFKKVYPSDYYYLQSIIGWNVEDMNYANRYLDSAFQTHKRSAYISGQMLMDHKLRIETKIRPDLALEMVEQFIAAHPKINHGAAYQIRGDIHSRNEEWDQAEQAYLRVLQLSDTACMARVSLAKVMIHKNQPDQALVLLNENQMRFPHFVPTYFVRAKLHEAQGRVHEAIRDMFEYARFNETIDMSQFAALLINYPDAVAAQALATVKFLGNEDYYASIRYQAYKLSKRYKDAAELCELLVSKYPKYYLKLGICYLYLGLPDHAVRAFKYGYKLTENIDFFGALGEACRFQRDFPNALKYQTRAFELDPSDRVCFMGKGMTYLEMEDTVSAIKCFSASLELDPRYQDALFARGSSYYRIGHFEKAKVDFLKFLELAPNRNNAIMVNAFLGNRERACQLADSISNLFPIIGDDLYNVVRLHCFYGDKESALKTLHRLLELGYPHVSELPYDKDLDLIRHTPEFKALIKQFINKPLYNPTISIPDVEAP